MGRRRKAGESPNGEAGSAIELTESDLAPSDTNGTADSPPEGTASAANGTASVPPEAEPASGDEKRGPIYRVGPIRVSTGEAVCVAVWGNEYTDRRSGELLIVREQRDELRGATSTPTAAAARPSPFTR